MNLSKGAPHVFRTAHLPEGIGDQSVKVSDLLVAATAAPTYFPHKQIQDQAFADGGLWATDPSMLAFAESMRIRNECRRGNCDPQFDVSDVHLLSLGTGIAQFSLKPPGGDAGMIYWAQHVADVMGSSQIQGIHQPLQFILGKNYTHLNFKMTEKWGLDETANIPKLFSLGEKKANEEFEMINCKFFQHSREQFQAYTEDDVLEPHERASRFSPADT